MIVLSMDIRNARLSALAAAVDGGDGPGYLEIYSGARPAVPGAAPGGGNTLIGIAALSSPFADAPMEGALPITPVDISEVEAVATTTDMQWGRIYDGDDVFIMDVSLSTALNENLTHGLLVRTRSVDSEDPLFVYGEDEPALVLLGVIREGSNGVPL